MDFEAKHGIHERWTAQDDDFKAAIVELNISDYQKALDTLERLMVCRLFELEKSNMRSTGAYEHTCTILTILLTIVDRNSNSGYKLRVQIAKGLQERSKTIVKALDRFNDAGCRLIPPRSPIKWKELVDITFIDSFSILRVWGTDLQQERWANDAVRKAIVAWQHTLRAREEILRIEIEAHRLKTWMRDEEKLLGEKIEELNTAGGFLGRELAQRRDSLVRVHGNIRRTLSKLEATPGYRGSFSPGIRLGTAQDRTKNDIFDVGAGCGHSVDGDGAQVVRGPEVGSFDSCVDEDYDLEFTLGDDFYDQVDGLVDVMERIEISESSSIDVELEFEM